MDSTFTHAVAMRYTPGVRGAAPPRDQRLRDPVSATPPGQGVPQPSLLRKPRSLPIYARWPWVQDVFTVLVRKLPAFRYDPHKTFRGWLRTVALNKWRDNRRLYLL